MGKKEALIEQFINVMIHACDLKLLFSRKLHHFDTSVHERTCKKDIYAVWRNPTPAVVPTFN